MALEDEINQAQAQLDASPIRHLPMAAREAMWSALGIPDAPGGRSAPHLARVMIMLECLRKILPYWESDQQRAPEPLLNSEDTPPAFAAMADAWMRSAVTSGELKDHVERAEDLRFYLQELNALYPDAELVANAACSVLWVAYWDEHSDRGEAYDELADDVFRPDFIAAWLLSGAPPWEASPPDVLSAREAFWRWYVHDLYPRAWALAFGP